jgi:ATP-dependent helicase Lhr and Lhr-like helicase
MSTHAQKGSAVPSGDEALDGFLPAVRDWFTSHFERPSPAQIQSWPVIRRGDDTLLLAPTGSGKTLAAFLCAIDDLTRRDLQGELEDAIHVLYISPLKALGNDIQKNLVVPLEQIDDARNIRIDVRTGDTPSAARARMARRPPHILITTPESLYLLLQSQMRNALTKVRTLIVDEVHALCDNKRGVHLSISLERLAEITDRPFQRVGCSATLSPLDEIGRFLVGRNRNGPRPCTIVDAGRRRDLDVQVAAPLPDMVEAGNTALWASAYELLKREIAAHKTTLVFCNSRYKAERSALRLAEIAGEDLALGVHHGSMARERRLVAEDDLKNGRLDALVATTSLELGIDIGAVDLVYQLESPKSVSTALQRIGRAGHLLDATSKGRILVFERDELIEAAAICRAMVAGEIDAVRIPTDCLDVLAQQIVGAAVATDLQADELFAFVRRSHCYRNLARQDFDRVLAMLAGEHDFEMAHPPRALVLWNRTTGRLTATRGAKLVSATNVGTIGESAEYEVVIDGSKKRVGRIHAEFVDDSLRVGDVFVLGNTTWRVAGVRKNTLLVREAPGATPTVPWWLGPVTPRTMEAGELVGRFRRDVAERLAQPDLLDWLCNDCHLDANAAGCIVDYVHEQVAAAGLVPDDEDLLVESWTDELGRANVIVHCPYGQRINQTWGSVLAAAAKERLQQDWQVTATNDHLLLTFPEPRTPPLHRPHAETLMPLLDDADLGLLADRSAAAAVGSGTAFRDAASVAFQVLRSRAGKRVPFWLQSHRAQELFDAAGSVETYPIVAEIHREQRQQNLDLDGLSQVRQRIAAGQIRLHLRDVASPSPFAHSLLVTEQYGPDHQMGRARRAHLMRLHRQVLEKVLSEEQMAQLLDPRAIERVERRVSHRSESTRARSSDELAQALRDLGWVAARLEAVGELCESDPQELLAPLLAEHSVVAIQLVECDHDPVRLVVADLWREHHDAFARPRGRLVVHCATIEAGELIITDPVAASGLLPSRWRRPVGRETARQRIIERCLRTAGPLTPYEIANGTGWSIQVVENHLGTLVEAGTVLRGIYASGKAHPQYVNRANLEQIHQLTMGYLKRELAACAPYEVVDFVTRWQHRHPDTQLQGIDGLREVIAQLQGFEIVTGALEAEMLSQRVRDYHPGWLDRLIAAGEVCWRRVGVDKVSRGKVTLCQRRDSQWLGSGAPLAFDVEAEADADIGAEILLVRDYFRQHESAFFDDVLDAVPVDEGVATRAVWYLAWAGELTCETYQCLHDADFQVTLSACYDLDSTPRKIVDGRMPAARVLKQMRSRRLDPRLGRWTATERLLPPTTPMSAVDCTQRWTQQLLHRWGIVSRDVLKVESAAPPWAQLLPELKRQELLGRVSRGYFIESHHGEQYGLPEAIELLRECRARRSDGDGLGYLEDEPIFNLSSRDPANLYASCLDIIDEGGTVLQRSARRGNVIHHTTMQAGQALVYNTQQLVTLTRTQLRRCLQTRMQDGMGRQVALDIRSWNDHPIDGSPVASVLHTIGFRLDGRRCMRFPAPSRIQPLDLSPEPVDVFPPYFDDLVSYGPEYSIEQAPESLRAAMVLLLPILTEQFEQRGWEIEWSAEGLQARYRDFARASLRTARTFLQVWFHTRPVRVAGERLQMAGWQRRPRMRVTSAERVDAEFLELLQANLAQAESITDRYQAAKGLGN